MRSTASVALVPPRSPVGDPRGRGTEHRTALRRSNASTTRPSRGSTRTVLLSCRLIRRCCFTTSTRRAVAGRDIYYDQRYVHSLEMRNVLEEILTHSEGVEPATLDEIRRYTKLFWLNSGPYVHLTARKFVLKCTPEAFATAAKSAAKAGASFPSNSGESLEKLLERLRPSFFDADDQPIVTNKSPGAGKDILSSSANNLYVGVEMKDLAGFREEYPLNSAAWSSVTAELVEEPYRIGGKVRPGDQADRGAPGGGGQARARRRCARPSRPWCSSTARGPPRIARSTTSPGCATKDSPVDVINGFIEVYLDARGVKGSWESVVYFVNQEKTGEIRKLAADAQWFEDHMPWLKEYRKPNVQGITANAIEVVIETGDCGPITPIGINLPNDQEVRERYGSKSVSLANVLEASDKSTPTTFRAEFSWTPEEVERDDQVERARRRTPGQHA